MTVRERQAELRLKIEAGLAGDGSEDDYWKARHEAEEEFGYAWVEQVTRSAIQRASGA